MPKFTKKYGLTFECSKNQTHFMTGYTLLSFFCFFLIPTHLQILNNYIEAFIVRCLFVLKCLYEDLIHPQTHTHIDTLED